MVRLYSFAFGYLLVAVVLFMMGMAGLTSGFSMMNEPSTMSVFIGALIAVFFGGGAFGGLFAVLRGVKKELVRFEATTREEN